MTSGYLSPSIGTRWLLLATLFPQALMRLMCTTPRVRPALEHQLTYPLTPTCPHITLFSMMMVYHRPSRWFQCQHLSLSPWWTFLDTSHLFPSFLQVSLKITFEKDAEYHKGYLTHLPNSTYWFSYKSHVNKKHVDWGVPLPNLTKMARSLHRWPPPPWSFMVILWLHLFGPSRQRLNSSARMPLLPSHCSQHETSRLRCLAGEFLGRTRWYWISWHLHQDNTGRI